MKEKEVTQVVPRKVRGTLTIKSDDDMEFRAERKTGLSSQKEIAKTAAGKLYRTVGEKHSTMVAHIVVPESENDPRAFLYEQADRLTEGMESKAKPLLRGRRLISESDLRITLSRKDHRVEVTMTIDLSANPNYHSELLNLMQRTNQCFAINTNLLNSAR